MSDGNPYKFDSPAELMSMVKDLGYDLDQKPRPVVDISRTPLETLWPTKCISHSEDGGPSADYAAVAFGPDVNTPWGPLPAVIVLLRKDVEAKLFKDAMVTADTTVKPKPKLDLFPPGWKPAPGFEDPRKGW